MITYCLLSFPTLCFITISLQLALSSDKLSALNAPLVNLSLDLKDNGTQRSTNIEMNKEELQRLISALEAANKVLQSQSKYMLRIEIYTAFLTFGLF